MVEQAVLENLRKRIFEVFPKAEPPGLNDLTGHSCGECDELRDTFHGKKWWELDRSTIRANYGQLALFQPLAYKYYLPAFILEALENFSDDDEVLEFFIYGWMSSKNVDVKSHMELRKEAFDPPQVELISDVLRAVVEDPTMSSNRKYAEVALRFIASA